MLVGLPAARADGPPAPLAVRKQAAALMIREEGHRCPRVDELTGVRSDVPDADEMIWGSAHPDMATCSNKRRYLIVRRPKRATEQVLNNPPKPKVRLLCAAVSPRAKEPYCR
jgi:hypothetical protein